MNTRVTGSGSFPRPMFLILAVALAAALVGCNKKDKGAKEAGKESGKDGKVTESTEAIHVVVAPVAAHPFEDWGAYSADLRGGEDATLIAPVQGGRANNISEVGRAVKAGEALCDIETAKYGAMLA